MFLPTLIFQKLPHGFPLCELSLPIIITARSSSLVNNVSVTQRSAYLLVIHMCHIHNIYERAKANLSSHSFEGMDSSGTHIICKIKNGFLVKVKVNGFFLTCSLFNHKCLTTWKATLQRYLPHWQVHRAANSHAFACFHTHSRHTSNFSRQKKNLILGRDAFCKPIRCIDILRWSKDV